MNPPTTTPMDTIQAERDALAAQVVQMREALCHTNYTMDQTGVEKCEAAFTITITDAEAQVREWKEKAERLDWLLKVLRND